MKASFPVGGLDHRQVKPVNEIHSEIGWSEQDECVPLKQRLKMLRAKAVSESREEILISAVSPIGDAVKKEDDLCGSPDSYSDQDGSEGWPSNASYEQSRHGTIHAIGSSPFQDRMISERREVEYTDAQDHFIIQLLNSQDPSSADDIEISEDFLEDLDHVVLKERQRMLKSRHLVRFVGPASELCLILK